MQLMKKIKEKKKGKKKKGKKKRMILSMKML